MSAEKFQLPERFQDEISKYWSKPPDFSSKSGLVDLGPGIPDYLPPTEFTDCLSRAVQSKDVGSHQYTSSMGLERLNVALSNTFGPSFGRSLDPKKEILVSLGAKEAIDSVVGGMIGPGDEIIVIEPFFGLYKPSIKATRATSVYISLRQKTGKDKISSSSAEWTLDPEELASKFNKKTKLIILNTPHNPTGKVFTRDELTTIADLCKKWDVVCLADEVYEWMLYDDDTHIKIATLPGMWERTITIGSAGKMLCATGWRIGWAIGPEPLIELAHATHLAGIAVVPTPMQLGVAMCAELELARLGKPDSFRAFIVKEVRETRDILVKALTEVGIKHSVPQGGYFLVADMSKLADNQTGKNGMLPAELSKQMAAKLKLIGIPLEMLYGEENAIRGRNLVRLCIVKEKKTIMRAAENIRHLALTKNGN